MEYIENEKEVEIDASKKYIMPQYKIVNYKGTYLVIAYETGNWIVLNSEVQKEIFEFLSLGKNIEEAMHKFEEDNEEVANVLIQLEAKTFTDSCVQKIENGETMQIYLTNACNLRCKHCYMYADFKFEDELTLDEIKKLCIDFKENGGKYITLTGGEVTTRQDFKDIIMFISQLDLGIHILSNGVSWDEEIIDIVSKSKIERVQISLDGFDEDSNSLVRGKGVFNKSLQTIDELVKNGVCVNIAVTPLYELILNNKEYYIDFAKEMIEKYRKYNFAINFSFELIEGRNLPKSDIIKYNKKYMELMSEINEAVYPGCDKKDFISNHIDNKIFNNCGYGRLNISPNGDVFFCSRITEVKKYGNIRTDSFEDILSKMNRVRKLSDINNLEPCNKCELKYICGGGCRVSEFFDLTQVDLENNKNIKIRPRRCTQDNKDKIYRLMIECNEGLFK